MFSVLMTLFVALLFVLLTPGILLTLPGGASKLTTAATHGLVFALLFHLSHKAVWRWIHKDMVMSEGYVNKKEGGK
jgi:hypothetical protein